ncbi:putative nmra-like family protein [Ilyonectria robusta]
MKNQAIDALKKTDLEYTTFYAGFFADFFTGPSIKTYMTPMIFVLDLAHDTAAIPGSGNTPVCFIHTFDLATYVALALDLEKWDAEYYVMGDKLSWNEFVKLAEAAKGLNPQTHQTCDENIWLTAAGARDCRNEIQGRL